MSRRLNNCCASELCFFRRECRLFDAHRSYLGPPLLFNRWSFRSLATRRCRRSLAPLNIHLPKMTTTQDAILLSQVACASIQSLAFAAHRSPTIFFFPEKNLHIDCLDAAPEAACLAVNNEIPPLAPPHRQTREELAGFGAHRLRLEWRDLPNRGQSFLGREAAPTAA